MRVRALCNSHYRKKMYGMSMSQMIADMDKSPSLGIGRVLGVRISKEARQRLDSACAKLGFPSAYKLASHIIETWSPKK